MAKDEDPLVTTTTAGKMLNVTPAHVRNLSKQGKLVPDVDTPTGCRPGYVLFRRSSILKLIEEREANPPRPGGRPKKKGSDSGK